MRRATIKAVAKLAGVSLGTVSRVLNGNETVGAEIRRKVEAAIAKLAYVPSPMAQALSHGYRFLSYGDSSLLLP